MPPELGILLSSPTPGEELVLLYDLLGAGWAEFRILHHQSVTSVQVSYLHDSLTDLADLALAIRSGNHEAQALFVDEPGEHHFLVRVEGDAVLYELRRDDWEGSAPESLPIVASGNTTAQRLVEQIVLILTNVRKLGPKRYAELWGTHVFPERQFDSLTSL